MIILVMLLLSACTGHEAAQNANPSALEPRLQSAASFPYPSVRWNHQTYRITDVTLTEVDEELGEIADYSLDESETLTEPYSNYYREGTKLYAIKGKPSSLAIAILAREGLYIQAEVAPK